MATVTRKTRGPAIRGAIVAQIEERDGIAISTQDIAAVLGQPEDRVRKVLREYMRTIGPECPVEHLGGYMYRWVTDHNPPAGDDVSMPTQKPSKTVPRSPQKPETTRVKGTATQRRARVIAALDTLVHEVELLLSENDGLRAKAGAYDTLAKTIHRIEG